MSSKINITTILKDHLLTFQNDRTGKIDRFDIITLVVVPSVIGGFTAYTNSK